ncbi:DsbA family protein [Patescibacteria group bacterium]
MANKNTSKNYTKGFVSLLTNSLFLSNFVTSFVIVLLIAAAYYIGVLNTKLSFYDTDGRTEEMGALEEGTNPLENLPGIAKALNLNKSKFASCLESEGIKQKVADQTASGTAIGVNGTPGSFLVNVENGKTIKLRGAVPTSEIIENVDKLLNDTVLDEELFTDAVVTINDGDHIVGTKEAKIFLIEYSDLQCPFCQNFHISAKEAVTQKPRDLAWVYRHFPLDRIHPLARAGAEASECAAEVGGEEAFWKFLDLAFGL